MEYLSPDRVSGRSEKCMAELETILAVKALAGKPKSRQWRFFRDAVGRFLSGNGSSEFDGISPVHAAQLKFEVEDKLRRFYLRSGRLPGFVFTLVHESELSAYGIEETSAYPRLAGYCVLVRDLGDERVGVSAAATEDVQPYLEKVVSACADAEFAASSKITPPSAEKRKGTLRRIRRIAPTCELGVNMRTFMLALLLATLATAQQAWTSVPVGTGVYAPKMAEGPDGYLYVATDKSLTKLDTADWQHPVWTLPLSYGRTTQPTGLCFHKKLGIILQLIPDYFGVAYDPPLWAIVPYDGSSIDYHQIGGIAGFGGGGCAVDDQGAIFLTSTYTSPALNGQATTMIIPPNLNQPVPIPGAAGIQFSIFAIASSSDGKTQIALAQNNGKGSLIMIRDRKVVTFDGEMPWLTLPFSPRPPRFSPDGGTVYISGNNGCPQNDCKLHFEGEITFDIVQRVLGSLHTMDPNGALFGAPMDFAFSDTDAYYPLTYHVIPFDPATWEPQGKAIKNPDNSGGNLQLLVHRKEFVDTLIVLQASQLLIWDVPRTPMVTAVVNSSTFQGSCAPNSWCTAFGRSLSFRPAVPDPNTQTAASPFPTQLDTAKVQLKYGTGKTFDTMLYYVSPNQVNFLMPADAPVGAQMVIVTAKTLNADNSWTSANPVTMDVPAFSPGVFVLTNAQGVIGPDNPAVLETVLTLWSGGLGTVHGGAYGLMWTDVMPIVTIGGISAQVTFSGLAPGFVGLYQVNVVVPAGIADGDQPLVVLQNGILSQSVKIRIRSSGGQ